MFDDKKFSIAFVAFFVLWLVMASGIVYVAVHFIRKFW